MVGIGLVGMGFMGLIHYLAAQAAAGGRVVALCSRDKRKLAGDWREIQGNFGPRGTQMDLSGLAKYESYDQFLADPAIQLVDLCVPNDQHAPMAIRALEAGKHVFVEKPIALNLADADALLAAAERTGRLVMVAHVLPFFPEFAFALDAVRSNRYGKLKAAHFSRVISKPDWSAAIGDLQRTGGPAIDLHIHDTHYIGLLCGSPWGVHSRGIAEQGAVVHLSTQYLFEGVEPPVVSAVSGALVQAGRTFAHGFEICLEKATLSLGIADLPGTGLINPLVVIRNDGVEHPPLGSGDPVVAFTNEINLAIQGAWLGVAPPALAGTLARKALATCLAEVESVLTKSTVRLDAKESA